MPKGVFIVITNCTDPDREEEFNRWYTHTHLPDQSTAKGWVQARRFVNLLPATGQPKFMTIYEHEGDIKGSVKEQLQLALASFAEGRHVDFIGGDGTGPFLFQEIDPESLEPLKTHDYPREASDKLRGKIQRVIDTL